MPPRPVAAMRAFFRPVRGVVALYAALGLALWPVPLLNRLHVESAAVVAAVAFFCAGLSALGLFARGWGFGQTLGRHLAALGVPLAMLTVSLAWAPNCGYAWGLLFFGLFPGVSVGLAVAVAYALHALEDLPLRRKRLVFAALGLGVALLTPLYDLGFHPQFYTYNHVFGGVLGPIYDEELALRPGLFVFRAMSVLWAVFFFLIGRVFREEGGEKEALHSHIPASRRPVVPASPRPRVPASPRPRVPVSPLPRVPASLIALILVLAYSFPGWLGINTPAGFLQEELGGVHRTAHFDLYYDPASLDAGELERLAIDHEYRYARLAERLGLAVPTRIASYLYPDAETKARLTGARTTNVAPVWLAEPQTHVLLDAYEGVFPHELAHVFSRAFGMPVMRASVAVGLVEGLAVALEPPDGRPSPHEQVLAAALQRVPPGAVADLPLAERLAERLSPLGFWTGRGAVSYTTMGSFVRYLLDAYGPAPFMRAYAWGDFDAAYGLPVDTLAARWERFLLSMEVTARAAAPLATRRFAVPSLFEQRCPHHVPAYIRRYREGLAALAEGDTLRALARLDDALARWPGFPQALDAWAALHLARDEPAAVVARLDTLAFRDPSLDVRLGDALARLGDPDAAQARYEDAVGALPLYAHASAAAVVMRKSLAPYPSVVRILSSGEAADEQARRLDAVADVHPAVPVMAALRWAAADSAATAFARLDGVPAPVESTMPWSRTALLERQRLAWLAEWADRAARPDAEARARTAAAAFRSDGALAEAARLTDLADRIRWHTHAPDPGP